VNRSSDRRDASPARSPRSGCRRRARRLIRSPVGTAARAARGAPRSRQPRRGSADLRLCRAGRAPPRHSAGSITAGGCSRLPPIPRRLLDFPASAVRLRLESPTRPASSAWGRGATRSTARRRAKHRRAASDDEPRPDKEGEGQQSHGEADGRGRAAACVAIAGISRTSKRQIDVSEAMSSQSEVRCGFAPASRRADAKCGASHGAKCDAKCSAKCSANRQCSALTVVGKAPASC
jgi:hypothetical protein